MNYRNAPENDETTELSNVEDTKLRELLGSLPRVDAPRNFEFAVKSEIARRQTEMPKTPSFLPILRFVLPLCLIILFGGFVAFNLLFSANIKDVPEVAEKIAPPPEIRITPEITSNPAPVSNNPSNADLKKQETAAISSQNKKTASGTRTNFPKNSVHSQTIDEEENKFAGTIESASKEGRNVLPKGINPNQKITPPANLAGQNSFTAAEILREIGIETDANLQVKTVKHNSPAERAGVKNGDVVEAIDDRKITPETTFTESSGGKTLHLLRGSQKIAAELGKP